MFYVYHKSEPDFKPYNETCQFPKGYELVAEVECEDLDMAFGATNHIEHSWTENKEIHKLHKVSPRSTSVGDIVLDAIGKAHYCEPVGWKELPNP